MCTRRLTGVIEDATGRRVISISGDQRHPDMMCRVHRGGR
jgi:hypothetical protein